jgi:hypothetical protein
MELSPHVFNHGDQEWKARLITFEDMSFIRRLLRKERALAAREAGASEEAVGAAIAAPVSPQEISQFILADIGLTELLHRAIVHYNDGHKDKSVAYEIIRDQPEEITAWLRESKVIGSDPTKKET